MYLSRVFISKDADIVMRDHAIDGIPNEIGGHLLGIPCFSKGYHYLWVVMAIPGDCISSRANVVIQSSTYDRTWNYVERDKLAVVGWYHTHPNIGIFLSSTDITTCMMYYRKPYQIAIVIDPIRDHRGVFGWSNEKSEHLSDVNASLYIGDNFYKFFKKKDIY